MDKLSKAILALEDGSVFSGKSESNTICTCGEVIFNTSITGIQEILTDPSYANQIVVCTASHMGNTGANDEDNESGRIWMQGLIVKEMSKRASNWRAKKSLPDFLSQHETPWIEGVDTRTLTKVLREKGSQKGCIMIGNIIPEKAVRLAKNYKGTSGVDLTSLVSCDSPYSWTEPLHQLINGNNNSKQKKLRICVYDFGVKRNILRSLCSLGAEVMVFPRKTNINQILSEKPDGIVLSNGPGDPQAMEWMIPNISVVLEKNIPILGICLGCQLLGLALGARIKKMKFGHHGTNHPIYMFEESKVGITSQNHCFVIDENDLPEEIVIIQRSLFDGTIQGIRLKNRPVVGFQGHPEASPGPLELGFIFHRFYQQCSQFNLRKAKDSNNYKE